MSYDFEMTADETVLYRYCSIAEFLWMISESRLYFKYTWAFDDPFEGQFSRDTVEAMRQWTGENAEHNRRMFARIGELPHAVCCFHRQDQESALMWRVYGHDVGVAWATTAKQLRQAMKKSELPRNDPIIGDVRYIDYEQQSFNYLNDLNRVMHKRLEFRHELESRASLFGVTAGSDAPRPEGHFGISIEVDLNNLVNRVVLASSCAWFQPALTAICEKFSCNLPIESSTLSKEPFKVFAEQIIRACYRPEDADKVFIPSTFFVMPGEEKAKDEGAAAEPLPPE